MHWAQPADVASISQSEQSDSTDCTSDSAEPAAPGTVSPATPACMVATPASARSFARVTDAEDFLALYEQQLIQWSAFFQALPVERY